MQIKSLNAEALRKKREKRREKMNAKTGIYKMM